MVSPSLSPSPYVYACRYIPTRTCVQCTVSATDVATASTTATATAKATLRLKSG